MASPLFVGDELLNQHIGRVCDSPTELKKSFEAMAEAARQKYQRAKKYLDDSDREAVKCDLDCQEGTTSEDICDLYQMRKEAKACQRKKKKNNRQSNTTIHAEIVVMEGGCICK